jgi:hypothetical protein
MKKIVILILELLELPYHEKLSPLFHKIVWTLPTSFFFFGGGGLTSHRFLFCISRSKYCGATKMRPLRQRSDFGYVLVLRIAIIQPMSSVIER